MTTRRELLIMLGAGALSMPLTVLAQKQPKVWRVGFLSQAARPANFDSDIYGRFLQGMRKLGYVPGENLMMEWRFAENKIDQLPVLASELVKLNVDTIVCAGTPAARAAKAATDTIPIVFESGDAVGTGMVKSLARPGGNATGFTNINLELGPKRLELLRAIVPKVSLVAVLTNPGNANGALLLKNVQIGAQKLGVNVLPLTAGTAREIDDAFNTMVREKVGAIIVAQDGFFVQQRQKVAELALKYKLPSISGYWEFAEAGGLMGYGQNLAGYYGHLATYVDKILKGAKPSDLPVEQPTHIELFINGQTAKALGLTIPKELLVIATKVIE